MGRGREGTDGVCPVPLEEIPVGVVVAINKGGATGHASQCLDPELDLGGPKTTVQ